MNNTIHFYQRPLIRIFESLKCLFCPQELFLSHSLLKLFFTYNWFPLFLVPFLFASDVHSERLFNHSFPALAKGRLQSPYRQNFCLFMFQYFLGHLVLFLPKHLKTHNHSLFLYEQCFFKQELQALCML